MSRYPPRCLSHDGVRDERKRTVETRFDVDRNQRVRLLHRQTPKRERGFSLVAAIFILVVLGFLAAIMVTIGEAERSTATAAAQGARAYQAAQAGIEWGVYGALNNTAATCGAAAATPTTSAPIALAGSLSNFAVTVTCSYTEHQEAGVDGSTPPATPNQYKVFSISATATFGTFGSRDFFSRTLQVTATDAQ